MRYNSIAEAQEALNERYWTEVRSLLAKTAAQSNYTRVVGVCDNYGFQSAGKLEAQLARSSGIRRRYQDTLADLSVAASCNPATASRRQSNERKKVGSLFFRVKKHAASLFYDPSMALSGCGQDMTKPLPSASASADLPAAHSCQNVQQTAPRPSYLPETLYETPVTYIDPSGLRQPKYPESLDDQAVQLYWEEYYQLNLRLFDCRDEVSFVSAASESDLFLANFAKIQAWHFKEASDILSWDSDLYFFNDKATVTCIIFQDRSRKGGAKKWVVADNAGLAKDPKWGMASLDARIGAWLMVGSEPVGRGSPGVGFGWYKKHGDKITKVSSQSKYQTAD